MGNFKVPAHPAGKFLFFFSTQFVMYGLLVANGRAYNQARYLATAVSDGLIAFQSFTIAKIIAKDDNAEGLWVRSGYVLGGVAGSLFSIWLTKKLFGH